MSRRGNPNFTGLNPERRQTPSEFWSAEDWAAEEAFERLYQRPTGDLPVIPPPAYTLPRNFGGLHGPPKHEANVRSRAIDALLEKHLGRRR